MHTSFLRPAVLDYAYTHESERGREREREREGGGEMRKENT